MLVLVPVLAFVLAVSKKKKKEKEKDRAVTSKADRLMNIGPFP